MKKVLVIEGGARRHQNSDTLSDEFIKGAKESGHDVEKIYLNQKNIHGCIGCNACHRTGSCVFKDDALEIIKKIMDADVICMVSPVYWYNITGQLKTLIDRTYAVEDKINNKKFCFILTCAAPYEPYKVHLDRLKGVLESYVSCMTDHVEFAGVVLGDSFEKGNMEHPALKESYELGLNI